MAKYVCSVCGYVYDDDKEQVKFSDLPEDWKCPLCGASKQQFNLKEETATTNTNAQTSKPRQIIQEEAYKALSNAELSILCTNLAKGCEKQYKSEEMSLFNQIADYYKNNAEKANDDSYESISKMLNRDLNELYPAAFEEAKLDGDRGTLRALTWSEKVTKIVSTLLERYKKEGVAFLENTKIFVCEICGFISIGEEAPEICPICKVPRLKFHQVGRV